MSKMGSKNLDRVMIANVQWQSDFQNRIVTTNVVQCKIFTHIHMTHLANQRKVMINLGNNKKNSSKQE